MPENTKDIEGFLSNEARPLRPKGKNYLLVIGINDYAHCPKLHNAVKDAREITTVLKKRFRFETDQITELYDEEATKRNIYDTLRMLASKITKSDNFLFYFSGHGEYDKIFQIGYWVPVEAEKNAVDEYIPNSEIRNILSAIKSHHTFLMVDSCFSGVLFAKGNNRNGSLHKERDASRWGLTAGRNEIVTDGIKGTNSPFAKSILYELRNTDDPLGVSELCDKVLEVVSANANQTPRGEPIKVDGHQGGQFVFHLRKDELADWGITVDMGTLAAFQAFVQKYPEGKNVNEANKKMKELSAAKLWEEISTTEDDQMNDLEERLRLINQYVKLYEHQPHHDEALNVGEFLEYKQDFLETKHSPFALRRFLKKPVPETKGADAIKEKASAILESLEPDLEAPERSSQQTEKASPFFQKYGKYLLLLFFMPILIFSIYKGLYGGWPVSSKPPGHVEARKIHKQYMKEAQLALDEDPPNYRTAKENYKSAIAASLGFNLDTMVAAAGIMICNQEIEKESPLQSEFNNLIKEGKKLFKDGNYSEALAKYRLAKGKIKEDQKARSGIAACKEKIELEIIRKLELNMISVQGGVFTMGCSKEQKRVCNPEEEPPREVTVSDFYIGKYEVTNEEFLPFLNDMGTGEVGETKWVDLDGDFQKATCGILKKEYGEFVVKKGHEKLPMIFVSWYGARAYAEWLKEKTRKNYRLPSEAEWEYAARGGQNSKKFKFAGSDILNEVAWHGGNSSDKTHNVGTTMKGNELGLFDMSGNVFEWTEDCWNLNYLQAPQDGTAWIDGECSSRMVRGGSWHYFEKYCWTISRAKFDSVERNSTVGFRLVVSD